MHTYYTPGPMSVITCVISLTSQDNPILPNLVIITSKWGKRGVAFSTRSTALKQQSWDLNPGSQDLSKSIRPSSPRTVPTWRLKVPHPGNPLSPRKPRTFVTQTTLILWTTKVNGFFLFLADLGTQLFTRLQTLSSFIISYMCSFVCPCAYARRHMHTALCNFIPHIGSRTHDSRQDIGLSLHDKGEPLRCPVIKFTPTPLKTPLPFLPPGNY